VLGWIVGNLHFVIEAQAERLLAPDDPALRQASSAGFAREDDSAVIKIFPGIDLPKGPAAD
jgi:hypothetical protein